MNHPKKTAPAADATCVVDRTLFKAAIDKAIMVVEKRSTIPILSNIKIAASGLDVVVIADDLDMRMRIRIPAEVDERMATTVPAHLLQSMCAKAPKSERVTLTAIAAEPQMIPLIENDQIKKDENGSTVYVQEETNDGFVSREMSIGFDRTAYDVQTLPACDFPDWDGMSDVRHKFSMAGSVLWNAIDSVKPAISTEETRYYLNGIYLYAHQPNGEEATLRAVATDGHRMFCQSMLLPKGAEGMPGVILPRKLIEVLHKLMKGKAAPKAVKVTVTAERVRFEFDDIDILAKVIDGTFPDYARIIPSACDKEVEFEAAVLKEAIEAVAVVSSEKGRAVKLSFEDDKCVLTVSNPDSGKATTSLDCPHDFEPMEFGLNHRYILSIIAAASPTFGMLKIKMSGPGDPMILSGEEHGWFSVLMPMRV